MNSENQNTPQDLYPHLANYSQEDKQWLQKISSPTFSQTEPTTPDLGLQIVKHHTIRSHKPWKELVKDTVDWVNTNIHPMRVISFSVVMCHSTGAGQCTIFYDDSKNYFIDYKIKNFIQYGLSAVLVETAKTWENHHQQVKKLTASFATEGKIMISMSELETGVNHNKASTILWFMKKY